MRISNASACITERPLILAPPRHQPFPVSAPTPTSSHRSIVTISPVTSAHLSVLAVTQSQSGVTHGRHASKSALREGTQRCSPTNRRTAPRCARTSAILAPARVETRAQKLFSSPSSMFLELTGATTLGAVRTDAAAKLVQGCGKAAIGRCFSCTMAVILGR